MSFIKKVPGILLLLALACSSCSRKASRNVSAENDQNQSSADSLQPTSSPLPPPGTFVKPREVLNSQEAMLPFEIKTMLRARLPESEILQSMMQRGLVYAASAQEVAELRELGASPRLLAAMQALDFVLTPEEFTRYQARQSRQAREKAESGIQLLKQEEARTAAEQEKNARILEANQQLLEGGASVQRSRNELLGRKSCINSRLESLKKELSRIQEYVPKRFSSARWQTDYIKELNSQIRACEEEASKVDWELRKVQ